jgi:hypothetical protein
MKNHSLIVLVAVCLCFLFLNLNCKKDNPIAPPDNTFALTVDDASCTEVYLSLKIGDAITSRMVTLKRDTITLFTKTIDATETAITDTSLLPGHSYTYTAQLLNSSTASSSTARTMDTTSHNIAWDTPVLLGDASSVLNDVAMINDTSIWAVGEIYSNGSTYNAAKWDGRTWELQRIVYPYQGQQFYSQLLSVFATSENDLWIGSNQPMHWSGFLWQTYDLSVSVWNGWINKVWGSGSSSLYLVGNTGAISRYNGTTWTKIESGTTTNLLDVYGDGDNIFIGGWVDFMPSMLLKYQNGTMKTIINEYPGNYDPTRISGAIKSVWVKRNHLYTLTGYDLYHSSTGTDGKATALWKGNAQEWGANRVRGNDINDIITVGNNGRVWHYNGMTWRGYVALANTTDNYFSVVIKGNIIIAVGERYLNGVDRYGLIQIGRR